MRRNRRLRLHYRVLGHLAVSAIFLFAGFGATRVLMYLQSKVVIKEWGPSRVTTSVLDDPDVDLILSDPRFTPERVVGLQVEAIRDSLREPERIQVCYSLASPDNRAVTGPIGRFAELVLSPPFHHLAQAADWQVGKAFVSEEHAVVLVSVLTSQDEIGAYRFLLRKQTLPPFVDCWMTDGVEPLSLQGFGEVATDTMSGKRESRSE